MTLDLDFALLLGVPIAGIAAIDAASVRQFILRDCELVRLASLYDEFATVRLPYDARNRAAEITVSESLMDDLDEAFQRLAELRPTGLAGAGESWFVTHCPATLYCCGGSVDIGRKRLSARLRGARR
jgi:hypothetical protein